MQFVSYFFAMHKKFYNFSKWKVVKLHVRSLDSPYTEHGNLQFHTEHHLNRFTHEYIKLDSHWLH